MYFYPARVQPQENLKIRSDKNRRRSHRSQRNFSRIVGDRIDLIEIDEIDQIIHALKQKQVLFFA